jgi:hypothetical protein
MTDEMQTLSKQLVTDLDKFIALCRKNMCSRGGYNDDYYSIVKARDILANLYKEEA